MYVSHIRVYGYGTTSSLCLSQPIGKQQSRRDSKLGVETSQRETLNSDQHHSAEILNLCRFLLVADGLGKCILRYILFVFMN